MPEQTKAWFDAGHSHYEAGRWAQAADALERALAADPAQPEAWYRLGNARQEQGRHEAAARCFERALELRPTDAKAWNNLGVSRQTLGNLDAAATAYRRATELDGALAQAHRNLAKLLSGRGEHAAAAASFERLVELEPDSVDAWLDAGKSRVRLGHDDDAIAAYRAAIARDPACVPAYASLGALASSLRDLRGAEAWFRAALKHAPGDPTLAHMLAAVTGRNDARPPAGFAAALFDTVAHDFDRHLVDDLGYRVPKMLAQLVLPMLRSAPPGPVVDLGCGTGLVGAELAQAGEEFIGVDLSGEMLREAERRGVYARLVKADILEELQRMPPGSARAVVAADVFIYLGELGGVFAAVARLLAPGGLFAFSLEHHDGEGYLLQPSGRYAQSLAYVRSLAGGCGLAERQVLEAPLRREAGAFLNGWLVCFGKPGR